MATPQELAAQARDAMAAELKRQTDALIADLQKSEGLAKDDEAPTDDASGDAPPPAHAEPDGDEAEAPMAPDMGGGDMPSHEELVAAFRAMSPDQLEAYKAALTEVEGGGDEMPPADAGATPPMDSPPPDDAMKSELASIKKELALAKSQIESLKKSQPAPAAKPQPRARTGQDRPASAPAPRSLTKSEIDAKLLRKSRDAATSRQDRDLINGFYCGAIKLPAINHLLKD